MKILKVYSYQYHLFLITREHPNGIVCQWDLYANGILHANGTPHANAGSRA